ncbi:hypothetical protein CVIRNUC_006803 [Coccomyxa viridis]|uniref:Uncharacterized protein n=1 Tax=Coccomyxa viridis TaxID=1274662 RepID=A0AAV1ICA5_9CHLO|nr:hypothetical protein CVIRNUC_006803 [Coccomyxa viridis]
MEPPMSADIAAQHLSIQPNVLIRCPAPSSSHVVAITIGVLAAEEPERGAHHRYTFVEAPQDCQKGQPDHDRPEAAQDRHPVRHWESSSGGTEMETPYGTGASTSTSP